MRLARAYDLSIAGDEGENQFRRISNAVLKYWLCKRAVPHAGEALECFGGNGYVEESGMPRLYRESPLNSIWEGSGNVQCLDVLRAMVRGPEALEAFFAEVDEAAGADARLDAAAERLRAELTDLEAIESRARRVVERMALVLQGSLVVRFADPAVADAFCASRLDGDWGRAFGTLPAGTDFERIITRHPRPSEPGRRSSARPRSSKEVRLSLPPILGALAAAACEGEPGGRSPRTGGATTRVM